MSDLKNIKKVLSENHDLIDYDILDKAYGELATLEKRVKELEEALETLNILTTRSPEWTKIINKALNN